jgi:hypothetical protein
LFRKGFRLAQAGLPIAGIADTFGGVVTTGIRVRRTWLTEIMQLRIALLPGFSEPSEEYAPVEAPALAKNHECSSVQRPKYLKLRALLSFKI